MKKVLLILMVLALFMGCEKEDDCNCYYSAHFNQYITDQRNEQHYIETSADEDLLRANRAECRQEGCY